MTIVTRLSLKRRAQKHSSSAVSLRAALRHTEGAAPINCRAAALPLARGVHAWDAHIVYHAAAAAARAQRGVRARDLRTRQLERLRRRAGRHAGRRARGATADGPDPHVRHYAPAAARGVCGAAGAARRGRGRLRADVGRGHLRHPRGL